MVTIQRTHMGTFCKVENSSPPTNLIRFAVQSFGFLLPRGRNFSGKEFADMIERYCEHPKVTALVDALRTL